MKIIKGDLILRKDTVFDDDLTVKGNIICKGGVWDIKALDIEALDIKAWDIKAGNISYYAVCYAYGNIRCNSIKGRREHSKHFCLDGKITIKKKVRADTKKEAKK